MMERTIEVCRDCFMELTDDREPAFQRNFGKCVRCGKHDCVRYLLRRACCSEMFDALGSLVRLNPDRYEDDDNPNLAIFGKLVYAPFRCCPFCGEFTKHWDASFVHDQAEAKSRLHAETGGDRLDVIEAAYQALREQHDHEHVDVEQIGRNPDGYVVLFSDTGGRLWEVHVAYPAIEVTDIVYLS